MLRRDQPGPQSNPSSPGISRLVNNQQSIMNFNTVVLRMLSSAFAFYGVCSAEVLRYHTLVVDGQNKIIPWLTPTTNAFDNYLDKCWSWALAAPNDVEWTSDFFPVLRVEPRESTHRQYGLGK